MDTPHRGSGWHAFPTCYQQEQPAQLESYATFFVPLRTRHPTRWLFANHVHGRRSPCCDFTNVCVARSTMHGDATAPTFPWPLFVLAWQPTTTFGHPGRQHGHCQMFGHVVKSPCEDSITHTSPPLATSAPPTDIDLATCRLRAPVVNLGQQERIHNHCSHTPVSMVARENRHQAKESRQIFRFSH